MNTITLSIEITAEPPSKFVIFENGAIPTSRGEFLFDEQAAADVLKAFESHGMDRVPIDFDHGMLGGVTTPEASVAAGWFVPRVEDGRLIATGVEWTPRAAKMLSNREYRFLSPAFRADTSTGRIAELINVALTNLPATKNPPPLVANRGHAGPQNQEDRQMSETVLQALGANDESEGVKIAKEFNNWSREVLSLTGSDSLDGALEAIKAQREMPEKIAALSAEIEQYKTAAIEADRDALIESLSAAGKLAPGLRAWAKTQTIESLQEYGNSAPAIGAAPEPAETAEESIKLSAADEEHLAQLEPLGVSRDQFINTRRRELAQKEA